MKRILILCLCSVLGALLVAPPVAVSSSPRDLAAMKQSLEVFEGVLSTVLQQNFPEAFALLEKPKGVYLNGFGSVFSFEIDIATVKQPNLFSQSRSTPQEEKKALNERLPKLRETMEKTLAEHGDSLIQIEPEEQIAVVAQLFNSGFLSRPLDLKTVIVRTSKKNLLDFKAGRLTFDELKKKMDVQQY